MNNILYINSETNIRAGKIKQINYELRVEQKQKEQEKIE